MKSRLAEPDDDAPWSSRPLAHPPRLAQLPRAHAHSTRTRWLPRPSHPLRLSVRSLPRLAVLVLDASTRTTIPRSLPPLCTHSCAIELTAS